jgi:hypothetical protein
MPETSVVPVVSTPKMVSSDALAAACKALGTIMGALNAERILTKKGYSFGQALYDELVSRCLTADQVIDIAARAFEAATLALVEAGHPGATVFHCNPTEGL